MTYKLKPSFLGKMMMISLIIFALNMLYTRINVLLASKMVFQDFAFLIVIMFFICFTLFLCYEFLSTLNFMFHLQSEKKEIYTYKDVNEKIQSLNIELKEKFNVDSFHIYDVENEKCKLSYFTSDGLNLIIHVMKNDKNVSLEQLESDLTEYLNSDFSKNFDININQIILSVKSNITLYSELSYSRK